jgi:hypothetical protein
MQMRDLVRVRLKFPELAGILGAKARAARADIYAIHPSGFIPLQVVRRKAVLLSR